MHPTMHRNESGSLVYYTCDRLAPLRHAFTTKSGGVSTGNCASLNLGFNRGDARENVLRNYHILADALDLPYDRMTLTCQVHEDRISVVTQQQAGMGLCRPMAWRSDAIITAQPGVPLIGFYADCVVTLLYDPATHTAGVCHSGWRGTAAGILGKTVQAMEQHLGARRRSLTAVMGPSICGSCYETDADVPAAMEAHMGEWVRAFMPARDAKFLINLQGINRRQLLDAGVRPENIIDSGLCTRCHSDEFWSHRATRGHRGVQGAVICL